MRICLVDRIEITEANANGITRLIAKKVIPNAEDKKFSMNNGKVAVLSSGGKESLLTYSILKEAKFDVHPIFFNESGDTAFFLLTQRHWPNMQRQKARISFLP